MAPEFLFFVFVLVFWFFFSFFVFLGLHQWHMETPKLGVNLEMQLLAHATATAMPDLRRICELCYRLRQGQILNPLSEARDQTLILLEPMSGSQLIEPQQELSHIPFSYALINKTKLTRI